MTKMKCLVFKVSRLHLNSQMIDAEMIVQFRAQLPEQIGLRNAIRVDDVSTQCFSSGGYGPNVQIVNRVNSLGTQNRILDSREVDMRRRTFEEDVGRIPYQPPRTPHDHRAN